MPQVTAPIVGMHFRPPAKAILQHLPACCPLSVVPEATNAYDPNALAIFVASVDIPQSQHADLDQAAQQFGHSLEDILGQEAWQLGYVKATEAATLAPRVRNLLDDKCQAMPATLSFDLKGLPTVILELP